MTKYRKKPIVIEATQWNKNGDHPDDGEPEHEGLVVGFWWSQSEIRSSDRCPLCSHVMRLHGWIDTLEGGHTVCPGDWIITGVEGERYPCKPIIFEMTYEEIEEGGL